MAIETLADMVLMRGGFDMSDPERRSETLATPSREFMEMWTGGDRTHSGESVTPANANRFGAVQSAWRFLSETEASLPCHLYRRHPDGRGKDRATDSYLYALLHDSPNDEMYPFQMWQAMRQNRAAWGNAFAAPKWSATGRWTSLWPLRPDLMNVYRSPSGIKVCEYDNGDAGSSMGGVKLSGRYLPDEIIHVRGMGDDLLGWSPIRLEREGLGIGIAAQKSEASFYKNGAQLSGIMTFDKPLKPTANGEQSPEEDSFQKKYAGSRNTGKVLMIGGGAKFVSTTIPPIDAAYLAAIKATRDEIWMIYGIPPHLMGDTEKSTSFGAGIEQQVLGYLKFTAQPSLKMTQQAFSKILIGATREMFIEFDIDGFLQADAKTRADVLAIKRQNGIITTDEWRALDNHNPRGGEEGDALLVNGTMIPIKVALAKTNAPAAPPPQQ